MNSGRSDARGPERWVGLILVVVLIGAGLRLLGLRTELWMDEILSLKLIEALESPLGVFTSIHHDNNHYLNSLWLYAVGADIDRALTGLGRLVLKPNHRQARIGSGMSIKKIT